MVNQVGYGFLNLKDRFGELINTVGLRVVNDAIRQTFDAHNSITDAMLNLFAQRITDVQVRYRTQGAARLQPIDENGRARPIKSIGHYDVAFPLYTGGAAWGATWLEREKWTVEDVNNQVNLMLTADAVWLREHLYAALFQNQNWLAEDDDYGTLTVRPLANGDGTLYPYWTGSDFGGPANHFLAQAAAISDAANPFGTIVTTLTQHPDNTGDVIVFVPTNLRTAILGLATFIALPDPNLTDPTALRVSGAPPALGDSPGRVLGYESNKAWIVEWPTMPNNYLIAMTTGGPRPIGMREETQASLRGFREIATREDHPFWESQWFRRAGFGAYNRTAAVVMLIGATPYVPPTDYALPVQQ